MPNAIVTIVPISKVILTNENFIVSPDPKSGQIQGRMLPALTLTASKTAPASGKGHQDARNASGTITFYNGLLTSQTISAGTTLTGSDGVQVITDEIAVIPPATPPIEGQTTVSAHALNSGPNGNIQAKDIDMACCVVSVLAVNLAPFQGGVNARDFTYVTKADIQNSTEQLKTSLSQDVHNAFTGQLSQSETLISPLCSTTTSIDRSAGDEAKTVTVSMSENCKAAAFNKFSPKDQVSKIVTDVVRTKLGSRFILLGELEENISNTSFTDQKNQIAVLTISIRGTWVYELTESDQVRIKQLISGKSRQDAVKALSGFEGIERVSISGIKDKDPLPIDADHIRLLILYEGD